MKRAPSQQNQRPSLREDLIALDRQILHLLLRRYNLLQHMKGTRGFLIPSEEKELREAWQAEVSRVSQDARLSSEFFTLMQDLRFLPKQTHAPEAPKIRQAFNLAPAKKAVNFGLNLPLDPFYAHSYLLLAALLGESLKLTPCLMHDGQHAFLRCLSDLGAKITTKNECVELVKGAPLKLEDQSLHIGCDINNFYLLAAQYIVRPSRVRFTAEGNVKLANLQKLAHFLPQLGARIMYVVPKSSSFPIRLESSGVLPDKIIIPSEIQDEFCLALLWALPFAEEPVQVDLRGKAHCAQILQAAQDFLGACKAHVQIGDGTIEITPSLLKTGPELEIPCEVHLASFLLTLPLLLGGSCTLNGLWPKNEVAQKVQEVLQALGLKFRLGANNNLLHVQGEGLAQMGDISLPKAQALFRADTLPFMCTLQAALTLAGKKVQVPNDLGYEALSFFRGCGLEIDEQGNLFKDPQVDTANLMWTAPSATWALAYATCACQRLGAGFKLTNAGIITQIWPKYWALYNGLPTPFCNTEHAPIIKRRHIVE
ncbi:MAG: hypothetical protein IJU79_04455 [Desulfovibrionaceae bacterium]|nr:hypothetical protein [Desulfovibrionaceae bacterium]